MCDSRCVISCEMKKWTKNVRQIYKAKINFIGYEILKNSTVSPPHYYVLFCYILLYKPGAHYKLLIIEG